MLAVCDDGAHGILSTHFPKPGTGGTIAWALVSPVPGSYNHSQSTVGSVVAPRLASAAALLLDGLRYFFKANFLPALSV